MVVSFDVIYAFMVQTVVKITGEKTIAGFLTRLNLLYFWYDNTRKRKMRITWSKIDQLI